MSCGVSAGKLNRRIQLQNDSVGQDTYGEDIQSFTTFATVWAELLSQKASEKFTGNQFAGFEATHWRIRYRADIDHLSRVVYDGKIYEVQGVMEGMGRKQEMILITKAILDR